MLPPAAVEPPPAIRIGAVSYLNSRPLLHTLPAHLPGAQLVLDLPSRLADELAAGRLDVALVPSIEYLRRPGCTIVSDACIACDGPVRSVRLYSRRPLARIATLALDEGSRTSAALVQILLAERYAIRPRLEQLPIGATVEQTGADAIMLIGDRGMLPPDGNFEFVWDLGAEWSQWTGLPFVFAMWIARPGAATPQLEAHLASARDEGLARLPEIARQYGQPLGIAAEECLVYLRDHLQFRLGPRQRQGLQRFYDLTQKYCLLAVG